MFVFKQSVMFWGRFLNFCIFYSVDRTSSLDDRIDMQSEQWSGMSQERLAEGLPPIPSDVPEYVIRPPLPSGPAPGSGTPTLDEQEVTSAPSKLYSILCYICF